MSEPYLSEIRLVAFNFAPQGWAFCNGQTLPINQYTAQFSLLGTTYGGDGITTFQLPNLQGRVPMGWGNGYVLGESSGESTHTLTISEMPAHSHSLLCVAGAATTKSPSSASLAEPATAVGKIYGSTGSASMSAASITTAGGGLSHNNMQPYLTMNFIIALVGIFPSRS
jgi:microcystin-dependent protein